MQDLISGWIPKATTHLISFLSHWTLLTVTVGGVQLLLDKSSWMWYNKRKRRFQTMTKNQQIRAYCLDCCLGDKQEVKLCTAPKCPLYPFRLGVEILENRNKPDRVSRRVAIKRKCRECEGECKCDNSECSLYSYRH